MECLSSLTTRPANASKRSTVVSKIAKLSESPFKEPSSTVLKRVPEPRLKMLPERSLCVTESLLIFSPSSNVGPFAKRPSRISNSCRRPYSTETMRRFEISVANLSLSSKRALGGAAPILEALNLPFTAAALSNNRFNSWTSSSIVCRNCALNP